MIQQTDRPAVNGCVLVTGGAGYIGSHLVAMLLSDGFRVIAFDNLSNGNAWAVPEETLLVANILDTQALTTAMLENNVTTVVHLAAKSSVPESFRSPELYFETNKQGTTSVVEACARAGVQNLIYSSTAAVYGNSTHGLVTESAPLKPISPYGTSKLAGEHIIKEQCDRHGIRQVTFRFFNVIGAHPGAIIGQYNSDSDHLLHRCLECTRTGTPLTIYGHDYETPDGTAERDYIHVQDLAMLHLAAIHHLNQGGSSHLFNAGYGKAHTVLQFINVFRDVTESPLHYNFAPRRNGDPASLIANVTHLQKILKWEPTFPALEQMISSSWKWEQSAKRKGLA